MSAIPNGWAKTTLESCVEIMNFEREPINSSEREARIIGKDLNKLFNYYGATGKVGVIDEYRSEGVRVLLGEDAAPFLDQNKDKAYLVKGRFWVNNHAHVLRGAAGLVNNKFLHHQLNTVDYRPFVTGSTRLKLTSAALKQIPLLLAPVAEQTRIVEKLEELLSDLDAGAAELKAAQKKLGQYRQSLLKAAVEGALTAEWRASQTPLSPCGRGAGGEGSAGHRSTPLPNPSPTRGEGLECETGAQLLERILKERRARWEAKQLAKFEEQGKAAPKGWREKYPEPVAVDTSELPALPQGWVWGSLSQMGWLDRGRSTHRPRNAPRLYNGPYPFVQTGDIRHSTTYLSKAEASYSEEGLAQSRLWPAGTMCITIAANIGKTAILAMDACFPDSVVGFESASELVSVRFIEYFMRSAQQQLENDAPATAQKNINIEILSRLPVPLPPFNEQVQLVNDLDTAFSGAEGLSASIKHALKQSAAQRKNILKAAFSGQLVPQDPSDEPASVLLERIRAERSRAERPQSRRPRPTATTKVPT